MTYVRLRGWRWGEQEKPTFLVTPLHQVQTSAKFKLDHYDNVMLVKRGAGSDGSGGEHLRDAHFAPGGLELGDST